MTKIIKMFLVAITLVSTVYANTPVSQEELKEIQNLELFKKAKVVVKKGYDVGSLYLLNVLVQGNADKIFLSKDKKYLIAGDVISTKDGTPLTVPIDIAPILGKEAFIFGKGNDEYIVFTDPECPYCKKFESHFSKIEDKVKIRVFFYPLDFHTNAKDISLYVMSQKSYEDKVNALITTNKDTKAFKERKYAKGELEKLEKKLETQMNIAKELGVRGTPAVFDTKGNKISWVALLQKYGIEIK